jgi:hypothetical protein
MFHQYNLTAQWEFRPNWLAEVGYVGNLGRNLLIDRNIGQSNSRGPGSRQVARLDFVSFTDDNGRSSYNALQSKLEHRFSKGLSILSAYTWSHAIDNGPGRFAGNSTPARDKFGPINPFRPDLERGNSDLDVRHRFTFSNVYDLPFGRNRRWGSNWSKTTNFLLGGFQINNLVTIQSGPTYTVVFGETGSRPMLVGDPTPTSNQRAQGLEFNPNAFREPTLLVFPSDPSGPVFGDLGRNTFRGQRQEYWDASLFKNFRVNEGFNAQVRIQAYNVLNHVNRSAPNRNVAGPIVDGVLVPSDTNAGRDTSLQKPRQMEFSLKLIW